jgi:integrase
LPVPPAFPDLRDNELGNPCSVEVVLNVFTSPTGEPLNPNTDYHRWKDLLRAASVRDGRLHDARHTAATVLLVIGAPDAVVDAIMTSLQPCRRPPLCWGSG